MPDVTSFGQSAAQPPLANSPSLDKLFTEWVLEAIPHEFQDNKRWGRQQEFPVRLRWRRDPGGRWETYREKELLNHGEWSKFSGRLLNPAERFQIQLTNIQSTESGDLSFDCSIQAALAIAGRQAQWSRGVQLYSVGFEGTAAVRLRLSCWVRTEFNWQDFPPEIVISPKITAADLELQEFRLDHVGKFGGEVAQQITRVARQILEEKIAEKEQELPTKLNAQIDKHRDRLRLKPGEGKTWEWAQPLQPFLPLPVKEKW